MARGAGVGTVRLDITTPQETAMEIGRFFNTAGPCRPEDHYMLPAAAWLPDVPRLVAHKGYFVIHAPRQPGKTTAMAALAQELTAGGRYVAVMLSVEVGAAFNDDPGAAELAILSAWRSSADSRLPTDLQPPPWPEAPPGQRLASGPSVRLVRWFSSRMRLMPYRIKPSSLSYVNCVVDTPTGRRAFPGRWP